LEAQLKALQDTYSQQEREVVSLNNRNKQLEEKLEKAQEEIERLKEGQYKEDELRKENEAALRKISLLETELENSDKSLRETTQK
jgi:tropomyosin